MCADAVARSKRGTARQTFSILGAPQMPSSLVRPAGTAALITAFVPAACIAGDVNGPLRVANATEIVRVEDARALKLVLSPDGGIFATVNAAVIQRRSGSSSWDTLFTSGPLIVDMAATSDTSMYFISRECGRAYRWSAGTGIVEWELPPESSSVTAPEAECHQPTAVWARSNDDVYVVAFGGGIYHWNGSTWSRSNVDSAILWAVGGDAQRVTVGGTAGAWVQDTAGAWSKRAQQGPDGRCAYNAVAFNQRDIVFASERCLSTLREESADASQRHLGALSDGLYDGATQLDGSALFWSYSGDVIRLKGHAMKHYAAPRINAVGGAIIFRDSVFVSGTRDQAAVILRFPL